MKLKYKAYSLFALLLSFTVQAQEFNGKNLRWNMEQTDERIKAFFATTGRSFGSEGVSLVAENLSDSKLTAEFKVTLSDLCGGSSVRNISYNIAPHAKAGSSVWMDGFDYSPSCTSVQKYGDKFQTRLSNVKIELVAVKDGSETSSKTVTEVNYKGLQVKNTSYKLSSGKAGIYVQGSNTKKDQAALVKIKLPNNATPVEIKLAPGEKFNQNIPYPDYEIEIGFAPYKNKEDIDIIQATKNVIKEHITTKDGKITTTNACMCVRG